MVELLAPAGSYESLRAAVNAGADAVYIGGSRFGARAYADNPGEDALLDGMTRPLLILGLLGVLLGFSGSIQRFGRRTLLLPIHGAPWLLLPAGLLLFTCSFIFI